jgi:Arc/MetJ-type ribon-helix-helix transcriptional regulator
MGVVQLPDELERVIERQVAEGRAASPTAFIEEAILRLVADTSAEEDELRQAAEAGSADIDNNRYRTVATPEDEQRLQDGLMGRLQARLSADGSLAYRLTRVAEEQIDAPLLDSARDHGLEAAGRYGQFMVMAGLGTEPNMAGSVEVPRLHGVRAYPARLARRRIEPARRVAKPHHLIVYRLGPDGVVDILGLVRDRMVLSRAARRIVRATDES